MVSKRIVLVSLVFGLVVGFLTALPAQEVRAAAPCSGAGSLSFFISTQAPSATTPGTLTLKCQGVAVGQWTAASGDNIPADSNIANKGPIPAGTWSVPLNTDGGPGANGASSGCNTISDRYPITIGTVGNRGPCFQIHGCWNILDNAVNDENPQNPGNICTTGCIVMDNDDDNPSTYQTFKNATRNYFPAGGTLSLVVIYGLTPQAPQANSTNASIGEAASSVDACSSCGESTCSSGGVGGIAQLPDVKALPQESAQPSSYNFAPFAIGGAAAALIVLGTSTWVLRRRRSTR